MLAQPERVVEEAVGLLAQQRGRPCILDAGFFLTHPTGSDGNAVDWRDGPDSPAGDPRYTPPAEALYDLAFDPQAACNRAGDPAMAGVLDDLRGRLDCWMADTGDPLLSGDGFVRP